MLHEDVPRRLQVGVLDRNTSNSSRLLTAGASVAVAISASPGCGSQIIAEAERLRRDSSR
jgi:hypothetical protein